MCCAIPTWVIAIAIFQIYYYTFSVLELFLVASNVPILTYLYIKVNHCIVKYLSWMNNNQFTVRELHAHWFWLQAISTNCVQWTFSCLYPLIKRNFLSHHRKRRKWQHFHNSVFFLCCWWCMNCCIVIVAVTLLLHSNSVTCFSFLWICVLKWMRYFVVCNSFHFILAAVISI